MSTDLPFSRPFDTRRLGVTPMRETIVAGDEERQAVARFLGILGVDRLEAPLVIEPWSGQGLRIEGRLIADVAQACIVTLEPVPQRIDEPFERLFLPASARNAEPRTVAEAEVIVHFDEEDPPDTLEGPMLDLGAILVEQLALALEPYPRAEGATLPEDVAASPGHAESPFAGLARFGDK